MTDALTAHVKFTNGCFLYLTFHYSFDFNVNHSKYEK
jgi:hypothetical protein